MAIAECRSGSGFALSKNGMSAAQVLRCPSLHEVPEGTSFCPRCGSRLAARSTLQEVHRDRAPWERFEAGVPLRPASIRSGTSGGASHVFKRNRKRFRRLLPIGAVIVVVLAIAVMAMVAKGRQAAAEDAARYNASSERLRQLAEQLSCPVQWGPEEAESETEPSGTAYAWVCEAGMQHSQLWVFPGRSSMDAYVKDAGDTYCAGSHVFPMVVGEGWFLDGGLNDDVAQRAVEIGGHELCGPRQIAGS